MNKTYWDQTAKAFESEIFNVFSNDGLSLIRSSIERLASKKKEASDLGCGIGRLLPVLSASFGHVYGIDFSPRCLDQARAAQGHLKNVEFVRADLSAPRIRLPKVDVAACVNAILMPSMSRRDRIFKAIGRHIRRGGHLLLVVPALESALLATFRLTEWNLRCGQSYSAAVRTGFGGKEDAARSRPAHGIITISGAPTKHYLREELIVTLNNHGFGVAEFNKLQYQWKTEFADPPRWMKEPYPWDWLILAQKE